MSIRDPKLEEMIRTGKDRPQPPSVVVLNTPEGPKPFPAEVAQVLVLQSIHQVLTEIRDALTKTETTTLSLSDPDGGLRAD